jgi:GDP-D-mannose dehydratase
LRCVEFDVGNEEAARDVASASAYLRAMSAALIELQASTTLIAATNEKATKSLSNKNLTAPDVGRRDSWAKA